NIALEIVIEAGWLAGAAFLALIAVLVHRSLRALYNAPAATGGGVAADLLLVFAGLTYWLICAAFSGDVNDNRPLWALIGMTLAALASRRISGSNGREGTNGVSDARGTVTRASAYSEGLFGSSTSRRGPCADGCKEPGA